MVKILVLKFKTIGDVLLITPLIRNLKLNYANSLIDVAINKGTEDMLTLNPNVNNLWIYDRNKIKNKSIFKGIGLELSFLKNIRKQKYDIVIDLDRGDRGAGISLISGAKVKIGSGYVKSRLVKNTYTHILPGYGKKHMVEVSLDAIIALEKEIIDKKAEIFWSKDDQKMIDERLGGNSFIHIHPFSRMPYKDIDSNSIAKIIDYCELDLEVRVVLTSAPIKREIEKINKILGLCRSNPTSLSGELTLKQIAALNKKAKLFIGVDTAIMHISAANDTPVLAFFGPTAAVRWGPWDNKLQKNLYYRGGGIQQTGKNIVYSKSLNCIPCNQHGCDDSYKSDCLNGLDLDSIKKSVRRVLDE